MGERKAVYRDDLKAAGPEGDFNVRPEVGLYIPAEAVSINDLKTVSIDRLETV